MNIIDGLSAMGALGELFGNDSLQYQQYERSAQEQARALAAQQQQFNSNPFASHLGQAQLGTPPPPKLKYDDGDVIDIDCEETKPN